MRLLILTPIVVALSIALTSWSSSTIQSERLSHLLSLRTDRTEAYQQAVEVFRDRTQGIRDSASLVDAQAAYEAMRRAWKHLEPLAEYLDPTYVAQSVNGAPLPRIDPKSNFTDVLPPQGMQIIDELLHQDVADVLATHAELLDKANTLSGTVPAFMQLVRATRWTDRMYLESARSGIMRVTTMGLSAFDRPASEPSIQDDTAALQTIRRVLATYRPALEARSLLAPWLRADSLLKGALDMLRSAADFDSFDRMAIIRQWLDPAYGTIVDIQMALEIEFADEVSPLSPIVNPRARSMFATDALLPYSAAGVSAKHITPERVALGQILFFDPILSSTNERACASCHNPDLAFTDGLPKSRALHHNGFINRNAPTVINAIHSRRFFYDLRANRMSDVVAHVVTSPDEFGSTLLEMIGRLRGQQEYRTLFARAFPNEGNDPIQAGNVGIAIAAYLGTLTSFNSPVDRYLRGEQATIDPAVRRGFNLFMGKAACATCHFAPTFAGTVPPAFSDTESEVLGVPIKADTSNALLDPDVGRAGGIKIDQAPIYVNSFKTPTIRNVALTAPYMHNGAYRTLEDVLTFYDLGGGKGIGIDHPYQTLASDRLDFSRRDYADLIAFMKAMTDTTGLTRRPARLPRLDNTSLNKRTLGGDY